MFKCFVFTDSFMFYRHCFRLYRDQWFFIDVNAVLILPINITCISKYIYTHTVGTHHQLEVFLLGRILQCLNATGLYICKFLDDPYFSNITREILHFWDCLAFLTFREPSKCKVENQFLLSSHVTWQKNFWKYTNVNVWRK